MLKLQLVDQKRLYARQVGLQQIGDMKAQETYDKEMERKHFEKQCQAKFCQGIPKEFDVVKFGLEEETHQTDLEAVHARSLLEES